MDIIPVIDILHGQVVRAVRGNRQTYAPIASRLCQGSDPVTVATALLKHCGARTLYVADLDAVMGQPAQRGVLRTLAQALPDTELWLDAGFADQQAADALLSTMGDHGTPTGAPDALARLVPVYGSESLKVAAPCEPGAENAILSLDMLQQQRLGHPALWTDPSRWPSRVIAMTLGRVGAQEGPDLHTLAELQALRPGAHLIGAGGLRGPHDLKVVQAAGAQAWLVASALHDGLLP